MKILLIWNKSSKSFSDTSIYPSEFAHQISVFTLLMKYLAVSKILSNQATSVIIQFFSWSPRLSHLAAAFVNSSHRAATLVNNSGRWVVDLKILMCLEASTSRRLISVHNSLMWFLANWGSRTRKFHKLQTHLNCRVLLESTLERISIITSFGRIVFGDSTILSSIMRRRFRVSTFFFWILGFQGFHTQILLWRSFVLTFLGLQYLFHFYYLLDVWPVQCTCLLKKTKQLNRYTIFKWKSSQEHKKNAYFLEKNDKN